MIAHLKFILTYPKIGPDMYLTHWLLFFKPFRLWFQRFKLKSIGATSEIRPYCTLLGTENITIGENVIVPEGTRLITEVGNPGSTIHIEDGVLFGPNVSVYSCTHKFLDKSQAIKQQGFESKPTRLKSGCWIGVNSVILAGVTVGKNSVIGANSVVTEDVPDFSVAVGAPARVVKTIG